MCIQLTGDIDNNPGPVCKNYKLSYKVRHSSLKSLKSVHKDVITYSTLERFQDFVYGENLDFVCLNETWLNESISNVEILHSGYTIFRKDRVGRNGGGVLVGIKTNSFCSVKEFSLNSDEMEGLEIVSAILTTASNKRLLFSSCYRPPDADWMGKFNKFLDHACDQFQNIVISADFNLPNTSWDLTLNTSGVNEVNFIDILNDHFLIQVNSTPTRANKVLDLLITSVPELVTVSEILSPEKSELMTDHCAILHEFSGYVKAQPRTERFVYNALNALIPTTLVEGANDINTAWQDWKDAFTTTVSHYIPMRKMKGRNPAPWINGATLPQLQRRSQLRKN